METFTILNIIFFSLFIFFSFYYIKILKEIDSNIEVSNELEFYKRESILFTLFILIYAFMHIIRNFNLVVLKDILCVILWLLYCLLGTLGVESFTARRMEPKYIRLNNKSLKKYLTVVGICIFVIYPILYLSIYFLSK